MSFGLKPQLRSVNLKSPQRRYELFLKEPNKTGQKIYALHNVRVLAMNRAATAAAAAIAGGDDPFPVDGGGGENDDLCGD